MKHPHLRTLLLTALAIILATLACSTSTSTPDVPDEQVATIVAQTMTAAGNQPAAPTNTEAPTEEPTQEAPAPTDTQTPPTETPTETPTQTPTPTEQTEGPVRVMFEQGATSTIIHQQGEAKETYEYVLQIAKGQMFSIAVYAPGYGAVITLTDEADKEIVTPDMRYTYFQTMVPKTQDYLVTVVVGDKDVDFQLYLATMVEVKFESGATSKTYTGELGAVGAAEFIAYASQGQKAVITLESTSNQATLHIYGLNDQIDYVALKDDATSWSKKLPKTQYYIIRVLPNGTATDYTLTIEFQN